MHHNICFMYVCNMLTLFINVRFVFSENTVVLLHFGEQLGWVSPLSCHAGSPFYTDVDAALDYLCSQLKGGTTFRLRTFYTEW